MNKITNKERQKAKVEKMKSSPDSFFYGLSSSDSVL